MQKHWDVMRSDDAGDSWNEISGDLPTDGFADPSDPQTVFLNQLNRTYGAKGADLRRNRGNYGFITD